MSEKQTDYFEKHSAIEDAEDIAFNKESEDESGKKNAVAQAENIIKKQEEVKKLGNFFQKAQENKKDTIEKIDRYSAIK